MTLEELEKNRAESIAEIEAVIREIDFIEDLTVQTIKYRSLLGLRDIQDLFVKETTQVPDYEPAVMGYLVNYQRIGRREICSALFDLISIISAGVGIYQLSKKRRKKA